MATGDIPQARKILDTALSTCGTDAPKLRDAIFDALRFMRRPTAIRRARVKRRKITSEIVAIVKEYAPGRPELNFDEIGRLFNIDGGRVSEILRGEHDHLKPRKSP